VQTHDAAASASFSAQTAVKNWILRALPASEYARIEHAMEVLPVVADQVLFDPQLVSSRPRSLDRSVAHAHLYFPIDAVLSLVCRPADDTEVEVGAVGVEGFVCIPPVLGFGVSVAKCIVQIPGHVIRLPALLHATELDGRFRPLLDRYVQSLLDRIAIIAVCNVGHSPQHRCARWLLMIHDRVDGDEFPVTQEFLAYMLGMSRQTVSGVARELQSAGLIEYNRGRVRVTDRAGLEKVVCHCYYAARVQRLRLKD
jgi:Crp-like helix-turn-helix domain